MSVADLIAELQKLPPHYTVAADGEEFFRALEIDSVDVSHGDCLVRLEVAG